MTLKLLSYNIRFGGRGREARLAEVIRTIDPDLVVFQEATDPLVIERLARDTGAPYWSAQRSHSIAFISRVKIAYHEWHYPAGAKHSFLEIVPEGTEARIFGLHLSARFSKWDERQRGREIRNLLKGIERHQSGFHVLVGDFNTLAPGEVLEVQKMPAWIRALVWISGRDIQRETIQVMLDAGYADGFRRLQPDIKGYTFPTWDPHVRLDYVFVPEVFVKQLMSCEVVTSPPAVVRASDHLPLLAEIDLDST
ncbi:MAG TPA: endonuclease/exonuclease/phosphatase family protein [Pyrinomonadaceae bacterium]|nr:endonuclease/exonuclease/phosphatase family protein [Pyrinomonadaceae bacterium]